MVEAITRLGLTHSVREIAKELNCSPSKVQRECQKHGLKTRGVPGPKRQGGNCPNCNQILKKDQVYCGRSCQVFYRYQEYISLWQDGKVPGGTNGNVSKRVRRYLYETRGERCEVCNWDRVNQFSSKIPLEVHHLDGDCLNNKEDNLQILCPNCHSLTSTYRRLNKSSGRTQRSQATGAKENHNL